MFQGLKPLAIEKINQSSEAFLLPKELRGASYFTTRKPSVTLI